MANNAFDAMNNSAGNDMYITGGAITMSEYEQNMSPTDQGKYETLVMDEFMSTYQSDPHKGNLDFTHWIKSLNFDLLRERAHRFDEVRSKGPDYWQVVSNNSLDDIPVYENIDRREMQIIEDAGMLQRLAHLHTGRIEDLAEIISTMAPEMSPLQGPMDPRMPDMAPQAPQNPQIDQSGY